MGAAVSPMTEKRTDDSRERFAAELNCTKLEAFDRLRQRQMDLWEAVNKALNTLMVGHAAGLVTCLTLMKDYNNPQLKGLGWFITLFGLGLFLAVVSAAVWIVGRFNYWVFPFTGGKRWYIRHDKRDWWTAALAFLSMVDGFCDLDRCFQVRHTVSESGRMSSLLGFSLAIGSAATTAASWRPQSGHSWQDKSARRAIG
jgi:hypothetical protein